ncbi:hypothetical protein GMB80_13670 [Turicibacter sanguinis]|nr:hypothetical protein [Turicibacter sanguinis]
MSKECESLHDYVRNLKRYAFPFDKNEVSKNGVYILFEKNEFGHNGDRIVRIGSHTGNDNLVKRLEEHFLKENKDRSIFRKNVGRALLNKNSDSYLDIWDIDLTSKKARTEYQPFIKTDYEELIEKQVSEYIRDNFTFSVIEVLDKEERLSLEKRLIEMVSSCDECYPSNNWLGMSSPIDKIRLSGLWQIQYVK